MSAIRVDEDFNSIAEIILFHRKLAGLSRLELAEIADVGKTVIFEVEHGKASVRFDTLRKILSVLNITIYLDSPIMDQMKEISNEKS